LIASLAFNLLVIGALGGAMLMGRRHGPGYGRGEDFGLLGFSRTLPAERRAVIRKTLQKDRASLKPLWVEMRQAREGVAAVIVAEPFDKAQLKAAIDKINEAEGKLKQAGLTIFLSTAEQLTSDERHALRDWWIKRRAHHFHLRGDGDKPLSEEKGEREPGP
jgi:uncharacterized membrane protein